MNKPVNYIASFGESFANSFNTNNIESEERLNVFNLAQNSKYKTKAEFTIYPKAPLYTNNRKNVETFKDVYKEILMRNNIDVYGFDVETLGSSFNPMTDLEKNSAMITEFSLSKMNVSFDSSSNSFNSSKVEEVLNYTFGVNKSQKEALFEIIKKVEGGFDLTSTEFASFQNLLRYGGGKIGTSKGEKYFKLNKDGIYSIKKHATINNQFDTIQALRGLENLSVIGSNQFIGTKKGDKLVSNIKSSLKSISDTRSILTSYNGDNFDIPFMNGLFKNLNIGEDMFSGIKHLDLFQSLNTSSQFGMLDNAISIAQGMGIDLPKEHLGTLISQGEIRGFGFKDVAHQAMIDVKNMLGMLFNGNDSLFNTIGKDISNIEGIDIQTFNPNKVLYSNKALRIGSKGSEYGTIANGALDQYIEDGVVRHYYSVSTNRSNYYSIDNFGFIPKNDLSNDALSLMDKNSKGLYFMKLNNKASGIDKQSLIFREDISDFERLIQSSFSVYNYYPDANEPMNSLDTVSQYDINKSTNYYSIDNIRARYERYKNAKGGSGVNNIKKDIAMYEHINDKYKSAMSGYDVDIADLSKESIEDIFNGKPIELSKINSNYADISLESMIKDLSPYNITKSDLKSFSSRYNRVKDEYSLNKRILDHIDSIFSPNSLNLDVSNPRDKNIYNTIHTDAYNYIYDGIKDLYIKENIDSSNVSKYPENIRKSILENNFYGYASMPSENSNVNAVDLLQMKKERLLDINGVSSLNEIDSNRIYTRVDASNINDTAAKIRKLASADIDKKKMSKRQKIDSQKEYLLDLAYDFEKRGVFDKGYSKKVNATDDIYSISSQIAKDLNNVIELAKSQFKKQDLLELNSIVSNKAISEYTDSVVGIKYANLTKQKIKTLNLNGHKIDNTDISNIAFNLMSKDSVDVDSYLAGATNNYKKGLPKSFSYIKKGSEDFTNDKELMKWFKQLGYTDKNIETLKDSLYGSNKAIGAKSNNMAFHFYEREVNGVSIPFMSITNKDTNVLSPLTRGEQVKDAANIMLPKVFNANGNGEIKFVSGDTDNRFIQIGGSIKSIVNKQKVYNYGGSLKLNEEDTIDEIFNGFKVKRNEIIENINSKDYKRTERSMNRYFQRIQLDEIGVSQKITKYNPDGTLGSIFVPRRADLDLANKNLSDELSKYIPYLYDYHIANEGRSKKISSFIESMVNEFNYNYGEGYIDKTMSRIRKNVQSNKNFNFTNLPPDMQEFIRRYTVKDHSFLEAIADYANINKDDKGYKIINRMIKNKAHSFTKDSHGTRHIIDEGRGVLETTGAHLSGTARSVYIQSRSNVPFLYEDFEHNFRKGIIEKAIGSKPGEYDGLDFTKQLENYGVKFSSNIITTSDSDYLRMMKQYDYNVINGLTANILQANPSEYLNDFNNIRSNRAEMLRKYNEVNSSLGGKYTFEQFEEVFEALSSNFTTYEQGGLLNPRMKFLYDKPQQFTAVVGKEYYDNVIDELKVNSNIKISNGDNLGYLNDNSKPKIFKGQNGIITGVEEVLGTEKKKYKVRYIHEKQNLANKVKLFTSYGEKGIFNIPDVGDNLNPLLYGLFDNMFGKDTFGVASYDLFKHNSFGALSFSYLNVMFDEYSKNDDTLQTFIGNLNELLPQYNFRDTLHPVTGLKQLMYDGSPTFDGEHTMYKAISSIIDNINSSDLEIDKVVASKIANMEKRGYVRTDIQTAPLEEGFGRSVKYEKRLSDILGSHADASLYNIFGDEAIKVSEEINKTLRSELRLSSSYDSGHIMLQNIKSTYNELVGKSNGIIKDISIDDIDIPHSMASYDEILDSIVFDFSQANEYGAKVNSFKMSLPGGATIDNPFIEGDAIDNIVIPLTKPYQGDEYMLSNFQKKIASVLSDVKTMQYAYDNADYDLYKNSLDNLNYNYRATISSIYDEFTKKDGLVDKTLKTVEIDKGGFSMVSKIVEPLLDDKTGGFLDASGKNFWKNVNGEVVFYDNIDMSKQALTEFGVDFEDIGKTIYNNLDDYKDIMDKLDVEKFNNLDIAIKNLDEAEKALNGGKKLTKEVYSELEHSRALNRNKIHGLYNSIGEDFLSNEGLFSVSGRYPFAKQDSVLVSKVFYNKNLTGNTFSTTPLMSQKTKLDTDADLKAFILNGLFDKETGKLRLLAPNSYMNEVFNRIHEAQATGVGYNGNKFFSNKDIILSMQADRIRELDNGKIITGGKGNYLELYKKTLDNGLSDGAKSILDFDNFFNSDIDIDTALKTISSKTSIGYISNDNFILRRLADYKYSNKQGLENLNFIQYFVGVMEQGIFNTKHLSSSNREYKLVMGKKYRDSLKKMRSDVLEESEEGLGELIGIINELGMYKDLDGNIERIIPDNIYNRAPSNNPERTVLAIKDLLDDSDVVKLRNDPLFWNNSFDDDQSLQNIIRIFEEGNTLGVGGELGRDYELFDNLDDFSVINLDGKKLGSSSYIKMEDGSEYAISSLHKIHSDDSIIDVLELKNQYGESYEMIGSSFDDISKRLTSLNAKIIEGFTQSDIENSILGDMFNSSDNFIREMVAVKSIGTLKEKKILNDSKKANRKMNNVGSSIGLSEENIHLIKKDIIDKTDSSMIRKYKTFYNDLYNANSDIFDETYDAMRFLKETNLFTDTEVMQHVRGYYDNMVADLSSEMNNSIRKQALVSNKKSMYKEVVPSHMYTSFDEFVNSTDKKVKSSNVEYTNSYIKKPLNQTEFFNVGLKEKYKADSKNDLLRLGDFSVEVNGKTSTLNDLTVKEIINYVTTTKDNGALSESQERAKNYILEHFKLSKRYGDSIDRKADQISNVVSNAMVDATTESAERLSKETAEKVGSKFLKESLSYVSKHKFVTASMIAAAIGTVSAVTSISASKPLEADSMPNGSSPSPDGSYGERRQKKRVAPSSSSNNLYLKQNSNLSYDIEARNVGKNSNKNAIEKLKNFVKPGTNINVSERNDISNVSDSWIKEKIDNVL